MLSKLPLLVLLLSTQISTASPSDWHFLGRPIQNQPELVAFLQQILDAFYPLEVPVTCGVDWITPSTFSFLFSTTDESGILAYTEPQWIATGAGYRVSAQARQRQALPTSTALLIDFQINLNPHVNWYYGTDGLVPPGAEDLATILLHETHHGLGFSSGYGLDGREGYPGNPFDAGLSGGPSQFTSNNLFLYGKKMYAPATLDPGSSVNHFDPSIFAGTPDQILCPYEFPGTVCHAPGPATLEIMPFLGWSVRPNATATAAILSAHNRYPGGPTWWQQMPLWGQFLFVTGFVVFGAVMVGIALSYVVRALRRPRPMPKGFHSPI